MAAVARWLRNKRPESPGFTRQMAIGDGEPAAKKRPAPEAGHVIARAAESLALLNHLAPLDHLASLAGEGL